MADDAQYEKDRYGEKDVAREQKDDRDTKRELGEGDNTKAFVGPTGRMKEALAGLAAKQDTGTQLQHSIQTSQRPVIGAQFRARLVKSNLPKDPEA